MEQSNNKNIMTTNNIILNNRSNIALTGISEVISTNAKQLLLNTNNTKLTITGNNINITKLVIETGELEATGSFDSITYSGNTKKTILNRIFK